LEILKQLWTGRGKINALYLPPSNQNAIFDRVMLPDFPTALQSKRLGGRGLLFRFLVIE
jgi:hypothetical protein